jgi:hypothetical protein
MTRKPATTIAATLAAVAAMGALPGAAFAQGNRQKSKNDMRNLAIAGAAVAAYGAVTKNKTATLLGAAGAGIGLSQYERQRKAQSQERGRDWRDFDRSRDGSFRRDGRGDLRFRNNDYRQDRDRRDRDDRWRGDRDRRDDRRRGGDCDD